MRPTTDAPKPRQKKKTDAQLLSEAQENMKNVSGGGYLAPRDRKPRWSDRLEEFLCKVLRITE